MAFPRHSNSAIVRQTLRGWSLAVSHQKCSQSAVALVAVVVVAPVSLSLWIKQTLAAAVLLLLRVLSCASIFVSSSSPPYESEGERREKILSSPAVDDR